MVWAREEEEHRCSSEEVVKRCEMLVVKGLRRGRGSPRKNSEVIRQHKRTQLSKRKKHRDHGCQGLG